MANTIHKKREKREPRLRPFFFDDEDIALLASAFGPLRWPLKYRSGEIRPVFARIPEYPDRWVLINPPPTSKSLKKMASILSMGLSEAAAFEEKAEIYRDPVFREFFSLVESERKMLRAAYERLRGICPDELWKILTRRSTENLREFYKNATPAKLKESITKIPRGPMSAIFDKFFVDEIRRRDKSASNMDVFGAVSRLKPHERAELLSTKNPEKLRKALLSASSSVYSEIYEPNPDRAKIIAARMRSCKIMPPENPYAPMGFDERFHISIDAAAKVISRLIEPFKPQPWEGLARTFRKWEKEEGKGKREK